MNNNNLRNIIFSYLRKYPKKRCSICECVCIWDKKVKDFLVVNLLKIGSRDKDTDKDIFCLECIDKII